MSMCLNKNTKMFLKYNKVECRYKSLFLTTAGIVVKKINRLSLKAEKNLNIVIYWLFNGNKPQLFFFCSYPLSAGQPVLSCSES
jgi:hypothetical protein